MLLSELGVGKKGKIIKMNNSKKIKNRLNSMGVIEGVTVCFTRVAPLGDPIELKIRDFYIAIRLSEARSIEVVPFE